MEGLNVTLLIALLMYALENISEEIQTENLLREVLQVTGIMEVSEADFVIEREHFSHKGKLSHSLYGIFEYAGGARSADIPLGDGSDGIGQISGMATNAVGHDQCGLPGGGDQETAQGHQNPAETHQSIPSVPVRSRPMTFKSIECMFGLQVKGRRECFP